jgi:hypothetical protein
MKDLRKMGTWLVRIGNSAFSPAKRQITHAMGLEQGLRPGCQEISLSLSVGRRSTKELALGIDHWQDLFGTPLPLIVV